MTIEVKIDLLKGMITTYKNEGARVDEVLFQTVTDLIKQTETLMNYTEFRLPSVVENNIPDHSIAKKILDDVYETYKRKNADYGNSFSVQYKKRGDLGYIIRKEDKALRFEQLSKQEALVVSESKEDTVMDSIGYDLLWLIEQEKMKREVLDE